MLASALSSFGKFATYLNLETSMEVGQQWSTKLSHNSYILCTVQNSLTQEMSDPASGLLINLKDNQVLVFKRKRTWLIIM